MHSYKIHEILRKEKRWKKMPFPLAANYKKQVLLFRVDGFMKTL